MRKAKRAECEGVLMKVAGIAERRKSATMTYKPPPPPAEDILANGNLYCPMEGGSAGGGDRDYTVTYEATSDTAFLVTATPIGRQSADRCGTLTLDNLGEKTASGVPPLTLEDCW
ncbi:MAG: type IV pilin protein [Zoogloeaceae bacterium]|nr:type IV pilin protein [Zoogloeaceae bacterium]